MQVESVTGLPDVKLITPSVFKDHRGRYIETFNLRDYDAIPNIPVIDLIQDDVSISKQWVLRGIHGDNETWKLVSCLAGVIYVVVVDCRRGLNLHEWVGKFLGSDPYSQLLIPPGFGLGHLVLSDTAIFHYKQSTYYRPERQFTIPWNDPQLSIPWPLPEGVQPILSERDANAA